MGSFSVEDGGQLLLGFLLLPRSAEEEVIGLNPYLQLAALGLNLPIFWGGGGGVGHL